jgi:Na+/H+ antiporter NhaD/arsenite permease-like protein
MTLRSKSLSLLLFVFILLAGPAWASTEGIQTLDLTGHFVGYFALFIFVIAYLLVMMEEFTHMRKSKPVLLAAGVIWGSIAWVYATHDIPHAAEVAIRHNILEYAELFLFLLVAMTYINAMEERNVFQTLRAKLVCSGMSYRMLFWITGLLAFFISPIADNLTTALLMCAVVLALGKEQPSFIGIACINIVVAANAGGAFSPFGDITTLMVWQKGIVAFQDFFVLFVPSLVNWLIPAFIMSFAVPKTKPASCETNISIKRGGKIVMVLFGMTIATAVSFHNFLHLPPMVGMMTGLAYLKFFGYYLKQTHQKYAPKDVRFDADKADEVLGDTVAFDIFRKLARAEWDTLMFFYGVILCVGGLGFIGYLGTVSHIM